jgi:hypothetical protein
VRPHLRQDPVLLERPNIEPMVIAGSAFFFVPTHFSEPKSIGKFQRSLFWKLAWIPVETLFHGPLAKVNSVFTFVFTFTAFTSVFTFALFTFVHFVRCFV